jgi:chromosome segregation ATPase
VSHSTRVGAGKEGLEGGMSAASSSARASKPLASALGNSLAVLLEESMAPLRARLASLEQECAQQAQDRLLEQEEQAELLARVASLEREHETMEMQTRAALTVQTKALDQALPRLAQAEENLAALSVEFEAEFEAHHGRHTEHVDHSDRTFQILEETLAKAEAQHAETFSELQEHQRETAAMHATHAEAIEAHRLEMLEHHAKLESHRDTHNEALASHADQHVDKIEEVKRTHAEMLESHKEDHSELVDSVRRDHAKALQEHRMGHSEQLDEHKSSITEALAVRPHVVHKCSFRFFFFFCHSVLCAGACQAVNATHLACVRRGMQVRLNRTGICTSRSWRPRLPNSRHC